jgi:hypothetical protein
VVAVSSLKKFPLIPVLLVLAILCIAVAGYRWYSIREEGKGKIAESVTALEKSKAEMLEAYKARIASLENWQEALNKSSKKPIPELQLTEDIKQAKDLKLETQKDADRFDFVQNQISEKITLYIQKDPVSTNVREMQKIEENINRKRKEYHKTAFQIQDLNHRYRLKDVRPVVFAAEQTLKDKDLF